VLKNTAMRLFESKLIREGSEICHFHHHDDMHVSVHRIKKESSKTFAFTFHSLQKIVHITFEVRGPVFVASTLLDVSKVLDRF
jgi:hypothetical protein